MLLFRIQGVNITVSFELDVWRRSWPEIINAAVAAGLEITQLKI